MHTQRSFVRVFFAAVCLFALAGTVPVSIAQYPAGYEPPPSPDSFATPPTSDEAMRGGGVSPFMTPPEGSDGVSFGSTPPATDPFGSPAQGTNGTAMMSYSNATANLAGLKYAYNSQFGDYYSSQSHNTGKWEQFPLTVYLTMPEGMGDDDKAAVKAAVSSWQKMVDITLVDQPDQAKIEITWVSELSDEEDLGETDFTASHIDSFGRTVYDKAIIRMLDPEEYTSVYPDVLKPALMHQIGHALGINTHSDNYRDLMAEPSFKKQKNPIIKKTLHAFAAKTLGQFIDLPSTGSNTTRKKTNYPPVDKISKRDLNTLYRLYNGS